MATAYTPILKLALPVTGELNGAWGDVVNNNITSMVEQAVAGLATINTWAANSHTLTTADGTTSESRCAMLVIDDDGAGNPSAAATVICPTATKSYIVRNLCGQTVTVKTSAGTGVAVPNNQAALVFCDGTNVVTGAFNGDVVGPATATNNAVVTFDGTTGKIIKDNSGATISAGVITATGFSGPLTGTVGAATPNTGAFTDFTASGTASFTSTGAVKVSTGSTGQQPGSPTAGMFRFNTTTVKFEGYNGTVWGAIGGGSTITNDTTTSTNIYPALLAATSGEAENLYTFNANLLYKPSTGEWQSTALIASNGIVVNSATVAADYTIPSGSNAMSAGPITVASGITVTVPSGSVWVVV
jgi:hypothetical protein